MAEQESRAARLAAFIYTGISLTAALVFYLGASLLGRHTPTAIYGGTAWVFLLSMIVTMPLLIPLVKARLRG